MQTAVLGYATHSHRYTESQLIIDNPDLRVTGPGETNLRSRWLDVSPFHFDDRLCSAPECSERDIDGDPGRRHWRQHFENALPYCGLFNFLVLSSLLTLVGAHRNRRPYHLRTLSLHTQGFDSELHDQSTLAEDQSTAHAQIRRDRRFRPRRVWHT